MTLQVALVGADGIVLASDRCVTIKREKRRYEMRTKIFYDENKGIASCWAKNLVPAEEVAKQIIEKMPEAHFIDPKSSMETIAKSVLTPRRFRRVVQMTERLRL